MRVGMYTAVVQLSQRQVESCWQTKLAQACTQLMVVECDQAYVHVWGKLIRGGCVAVLLLLQGEPELERLKRELEELKHAPRGLEGTFRTAAEMERHRCVSVGERVRLCVVWEHCCYNKSSGPNRSAC